MGEPKRNGAKRSDEQTRRLGTLMNVSVRIVGEYLADQYVKLSTEGLHFREIICLETIERLDQPTMGDLASALEISKPALTALIRDLEEKGYVERIRVAADRRSYRVSLTDHGERLGRFHEEAYQGLAELLVGNLDPSECEALISSLACVVAKNGFDPTPQPKSGSFLAAFHPDLKNPRPRE